MSDQSTKDASRPSLIKTLETWLGLAVAVAGLLTPLIKAIDVLTEVVRKIPGLRSIADRDWFFLLCLAAALLVAGIASFLHGRSRKSRLAESADLTLDSDNAEHLAGRTEDINLLSDHCQDNPLVFVVGESGAGKSALIRAGLIPKLRKEKLVPIYVDVYGRDWIQGPSAALSEALWDSLAGFADTACNGTNADQLRQRLDLAKRHDPENVCAALARFHTALGWKPILIFDQFDDYQAIHKDRFVPGGKRAWIKPTHLTRVNSFWKNIKELLSNNRSHAMFVTRLDGSDGLGCVKFLSEPLSFHLDPIKTADVSSLLARLTAPRSDGQLVVLDPQHGWNQLRLRLARDLQTDGTILPARLKLALQGLKGLDTLTIGAYEEAGGIVGLEARHIQGHVKSAAQASSLSEATTRQLLLALVDPKSLTRGDQNSLKTRARSLADLRVELGTSPGMTKA